MCCRAVRFEFCDPPKGVGCLGVVSIALQRQAEVAMHQREFWVQLDGLAVFGDGFLAVTALPQVIAEAIVAKRVIGVQFKAPAECGDGPVPVRTLPQSTTEIEMVPGVARIECNRLAKGVGRFGVFSTLCQGTAQASVSE